MTRGISKRISKILVENLDQQEYFTCKACGAINIRNQEEDNIFPLEVCYSCGRYHYRPIGITSGQKKHR